MAKKINFGWLKDQDGNRFAPKTFISKVITTSGKTLESILDKIEQTLSEKISSPSSAKVGQNLTVKEVDKNGKPVSWKCVDVQDQVQADYNQTDSTKPDFIKNKPTNLVKNTDYASSTKAGLVKTSSSYGAELAGGYLQIVKATNDEILARANNYKPIVPSSLDYAVKKALSDCKKTTWTEDEKAKARDLLGVEANPFVETVRVDIRESITSNADETFSAELYEALVTKNIENITISNYTFSLASENDEYIVYKFLKNGYEYKFTVDKNNPDDEFTVMNMETYGMSLESWSFSGYYTKEVVKQLDEKFIPDNIPKVQSASIGQILEVEDVDENGKPTKWKAINKPSIQADWEQNNNSQSSYIKNKPFYYESTIFFEGDISFPGYINSIQDYYFPTPLDLNDGDEFLIQFKDIGTFRLNVGEGAEHRIPEEQITMIADNFTVYKDRLNFYQHSKLNYSIKIFKESFKQLDEKFIPDNIPKISTADIGQTLIVEEIDENGKPVKWNTIDIPDTTNDIKHGENFLSDLININLLDIDYDTLLAFDTSEIVIQSTATATSSVLGQAILGQMILG